MKLQVRYPAILGTAIVAGVFSLIVALLLAIDFVGRGSYELFDTPAYLQLKEQLAEKPNDPQIQEAIRQIDLRLRIDYFRHRQFMVNGIRLLLGGVVVSLITARWASSLRPKMPHPEPESDEVDQLAREQRLGRRGSIALIAAIVLLMCGFVLKADRLSPPRAAGAIVIATSIAWLVA